MNDSQNKADLRRIYRQARRVLSAQERQKESASTVAVCLALKAQLGVTTIASYWATPEELDLAGLHQKIWAEAGIVLLPRISAPGFLTWHKVGPDDALCMGSHGFPEPDLSLPSCPLDPGTLLLVPGVAFSASGVRLGQGGGYYDRFLPRLGVISVGVGFACQRFDGLRQDGHDRLVDGVVLGGSLIRDPSARIET